VAADVNTAKISELASRYVSDNVRLWQRYAEGLRRVSEGVMPRAQTAEKPGASLADVPIVAQQLIQLNLTHYSELLNTYAEFTNQILSTVLQPQDSAPAGTAPPNPAPAPVGTARLELIFDGGTGETVSQSFAVANKETEPIDVRFELTEFVAEEGIARFRAPVIFAPDTFVLSPGAEQIVECRIPLVAAFVPGTRYMALVRVTGFPALDTALIVVPHARTNDVAGERPVQDGELAPTPPMIDATVVARSESRDARVSRPRTKTAGSRRKRGRRKGPARTS
jgi:hypothetical protein